ncbi:MAG: shikimate kinase [Lachnospiraceae bacterium]|nr:shikimate kinase [Lachnospiraceae bacterium]
MKENVVLIGMPASGKSTIGVILSKVMGYDFVDTDLLIQKRERRLLWEIIAQNGIDAFLSIEGEVCGGLCAERSVIATGGSVIYRENGMRRLKEIGTIVYLKTEFDELCRRLGNIHDRGVVLKPGQTFRDLYDERIPLYETWADLTVEEAGKTQEEIMQEICRRIIRHAN